MTNKNEKKLRIIFERKIIRRVYEHRKVGNDEQRPLINFEIAELLEGEDIAKVNNLMRKQWCGHVLRREDSSMYVYKEN